MKKVFATIAFVVIGLTGFAQERLSVRDFLKLSPSDTTSYIVSGVVEKVRSSSRASVYVNDGTGTLLVYGFRDLHNPTMSLKEMDIVKGDTVTILGRFTIYNETTKEMKDGRLISKANGPDHDIPFMERLDKKPSFKGKEGDESLKAFSEWVHSKIVKPEGSAPGSVEVSFAVGRNGKVQEVQVVGGSHDQALRDEAVRVVKSSPKWKPAQMDGNTLRLPAHITVHFK